MGEENKKLSRRGTICQLNELIEVLDKKTTTKTKEKKRKALKKLPQTKDNLQETIDYLRVAIKYSVFDLEATRRENEYLRKLLEENGIK